MKPVQKAGEKREVLASTLESLLTFNLVIPTVLTQSDWGSITGCPDLFAV